MNHSREFTEEVLMSFADGELDDATAAEVASALSSDPSLEARVERYRRTRILAADAFGEHAASDVPEALRRSVSDAVSRAVNAVGPGAPAPGPGPVAASRPAANAPRYLLVASLSAMVFGVAAFMAGQRAASPVQVAAPSLPGELRLVDPTLQPALEEALSGLASGTSAALGDGRIELTSTHVLEGGALCREFTFVRGETAVEAIACYEQRHWSLAVAARNPYAADYSPASSAHPVDAWLVRSGAGPALRDESESAALDALRVGRSNPRSAE